MIDYQRLKDWRIPEAVQRYGADDCMRYALALGLGGDPLDARQLRFVEDSGTGRPQALPTMAVVLAYPGSWMADPATGIDFARIVHGEERVHWHRPLPAAGAVRSRHRVTHVVDKGAGRGALVVYEKELSDADSGLPYATVVHTTFARGDGGFATPAVPGDAPPPGPEPVPATPPDAVQQLATLPQQALLYRLVADRNPLHSDPATARAAGFGRPILHGLCTWGMAGHALLAQHGASEPARMRSLYARFSAPVMPGETLQLESWQSGDTLRFRMRAPELGCTVLDHGHAVIAAAA